MPQANPLMGVVLVLFSVFIFALADTLTKQLAMAYPVTLVQAVRYGVNLLLITAALMPKYGAQLWHTRRTGLVLLRGLTLATASLTMSFALQFMPLGETVAIAYLAPFIVMLLSGPLLGERASLVGWIGAVVSFTGVVMIARPGGNFGPDHLFPTGLGRGDGLAGLWSSARPLGHHRHGGDRAVRHGGGTAHQSPQTVRIS